MHRIKVELAAFLHFLDLLDDWCGGLLAYYLFYYKTQKSGFVVIFWLTVIINIVMSFYLIFEQPPILLAGINQLLPVELSNAIHHLIYKWLNLWGL